MQNAEALKYMPYVPLKYGNCCKLPPRNQSVKMMGWSLCVRLLLNCWRNTRLPSDRVVLRAIGVWGRFSVGVYPSDHCISHCLGLLVSLTELS